jgi:uncharacterized protein YciI
MATYVLICTDRPGSLALRMATREAHLAYARAQGDRLRLGGPILDDQGEMAGSIILYEAESLEDAQAFSAADPYRLAGLFERVEIHPFRVTIGQLG